MVVNGSDQGLIGDQRSRVTNVLVTFDQPVTLDAGAFTLARAVNSDPLDTTITPTSTDGGLSWTLRFTGSDVAGESLADGRYTLTMDHTKVKLAASPTITPQVDSVMSFHRYFGDVNGDAFLDAGDLYPYLITTLDKPRGADTFNAAFDYNDDFVDAGDLYPFLIPRLDKPLSV
jgi:hypothetical protein